MDKAANPDLYNSLNEIGEVFESLSGLVLAISFFFILIELRNFAAT